MSAFVIPTVFKDPVHIMELKRQPKKAFRIIKLIKSKSYQQFLTEHVKKVLSSKP